MALLASLAEAAAGKGVKGVLSSLDPSDSISRRSDVLRRDFVKGATLRGFGEKPFRMGHMALLIH